MEHPRKDQGNERVASSATTGSAKKRKPKASQNRKPSADKSKNPLPTPATQQKDNHPAAATSGSPRKRKPKAAQKTKPSAEKPMNSKSTPPTHQEDNHPAAGDSGKIATSKRKNSTPQRKGSADATRPKQNTDGAMSSFKWQYPGGKEEWWHKEMMKYISSKPEDLGKLEHELKKVNAVVSLTGNHVIVSPRIVGEKATCNWRTECERVLEEIFSKYTVRTVEVDTFDPTHYNDSSVDVHLQKSLRGVLTISVTGPVKLVEQTVYQVRQRSNQVESKEMYIKPGDTHKITQDVKQKVRVETDVKLNWSKQNFLKFTGKKDSIKKAKKIVNEQMKEANDEICINQSHVHRVTDGLLQHVGTTTGVSLRWTNPGMLSIHGNPRNVEKARQIIIDEIFKIDNRTIAAPYWIFQRCHNKVTQAKHIFPEVEISTQGGVICIRGHPAEIENVFNEFVGAVNQYGEWTIPVKKEFHPALVGKGGTKANELQTKYNIHLLIPPPTSNDCVIVIRGEKRALFHAKAEIEDFIRQLVAQHMELLVPLSRMFMMRIGDELIKRMESSNSVQLMRNQNGIFIKGRREAVQNVRSAIMQEISATVQVKISAAKWMKKRVLDSLKEKQMEFPDLQVDSRSAAGSIKLTGHPSEVKMFGDLIRSEVAKLGECRVLVGKEFHAAVMGKGGSNLQKLQKKHDITIVIPPANSSNCEITLKGATSTLDDAKSEIVDLVLQLKLQGSEFHVPLSLSHMARIGDDFIKKLEKAHDIQFTKTADGISIRGKKEVHQKVQDAIMSEIAITEHGYVAVEDWLKPLVLDSLKDELKEFSDLQVAPDCVVDEIVLTGHPCDVGAFGDLMRSRVAELDAYYNFVVMNVRKEFHKCIIGTKGNNIKKLRDQHKVDVIIPPNLSESCEVRVQGPRLGVDAAVEDIKSLVDNLDRSSKKILRFPKEDMDDVKYFSRELKSRYPQVKIEFRHTKATFTGSFNEVEALAVELEDKLKIKRQSMQTISIPLSSAQALAVKILEKTILDDLRRIYDKMTIVFERNVPSLLLKGEGPNLNELHVKVVERIQEYSDFRALDIKIDDSVMGKFIGKGGQNIKSLEMRYPEVKVFVDKQQDRSSHGSNRKNVTIVGGTMRVEQVFSELRYTFAIEKIGDQSYKMRGRRMERHASMASLPTSSVSSYNGDEDDEEEDNLSDYLANPEAVCCKWRVLDGAILQFVKESDMFSKQLEQLFRSDESVVLNSRKRTVTVAGQSSNSDRWNSSVETKLTDFFKDFACCDVPFHPRTEIDKTDVNTKNLVVVWNELTASICGLKDKVDEKLAEFESVKNRKISVSTKFPTDKYFLLFMKKNLRIEQTGSSDSTHILISNEHAEFQSEILEVASVENWEKSCKKELDDILSRLACEKMKIPLIQSGHMRKECRQQDELVVEWVQEDNALVVYGLKEFVVEEIRRLKNVLYDLENKKKNVMLEYKTEQEKILAFIGASTEHLESFVKHLANLGSPIISNGIVTVHGEILETESTAEWEEKCRHKIEKKIRQYKMVHIEVEEHLWSDCVSLAKTGSGVTTKWIESEGCFCVIGLNQLVDATEIHLKEKMKEFGESKLSVNTSDDQDSVDLHAEKEASIIIQVNEDVLKFLDSAQSRESLKEVKVQKSADGVVITGKGRYISHAKKYIDSIFVKNFSMMRYGVYEFLKESATRWKIEALEIEHNCSIQIERLPDSEYGSRRFIALPKRSNLSVRVKEGDIVEEDVDIIVNTTNKSFSFDGPLSRYVFQKAGEHLRHFVCAIDNNIQMSDAGSLKCKKIFHVAIPKTSESMEDLMLAILREADKLKMKSIALPTIGAGNGGWNSQDISMSMQTAFTKFGEESDNLKAIHVVLFNMAASDKKLFRENLDMQHHQGAAPAATPVPESPGLFSSFMRRIFSKRPEPVPVQQTTPKPIDPPVAARSGGSREGQHARVFICANSEDNLSKAVADVKTLADRSIKEFILDSTAVLNINQSDLDKIEKMANDDNVRVIVNKKRDVHTVTIQGSDDSALKIYHKVQDMVRGISTDLPAEWVPSDEKMKSVVLARNSPEFSEIENLFNGANKRHGLRFSVHSISRIQNASLYRQYQSKKGEIANRSTPPANIEMRLFHGTDKDTVDSICRHGFNRSYAGRNATAYGEGTYFSTESSYSNSYTKVDSANRRQMIVAQVLTGDYCKGDSSMVDAPRNTATDELYDSVVDRCGFYTPSIYVVFRDWSAYPSYVITYVMV